MLLLAAVALAIGCGPRKKALPPTIVSMVGDSITRGYDCSSTVGATTYDGYRAYLDQHASTDGFSSLVWVGTQSNVTAPWTPTRNHDGINGDNAWAKLAGKEATNGAGFATSSVDNLFGAGKPAHGAGVVLVNLGTNVEDGGTFAANYKLLVEYIHTQEPQAKIVVNTVFSGPNVAANNTSLTTATSGVWDQLSAEGISLYRATTTLVGGDLCDGTHPNSTGAYPKLGGNIYPAFKAALSGAAPGSY